MEQSRLIIAIALSFLVFFLWEILTIDKESVQQATQKQTQENLPITEEANAKVQDQSRPHSMEKDSQFPQAPVSPAPEHARIITVDTPLYRAKISEHGAVLKSFVLKQYREKASKDSPLLEMIDPAIKSGTIEVDFHDRSVQGISNAIFAANVTTDEISINQSGKTLKFQWISPEGIIIIKKFLFKPDSYLIGFTVGVKNNSGHAFRDRLMVSLKKIFPEQKRSIGFRGPSALINNDLTQVDLDDIEEKNRYTGEFKWITVQDRYFLSSLIPEIPVQATMNLYLPNNFMVENQLVMPESDFGLDGENRFSFQLFYGPKSTKLLKTIDYDLYRAINFGMFDIIAKPCVWIMNFLFGIIPNYGVAIIILTLLTKIMLWPLGSKSYKSMAEMKKIQPLMTEIREKYKNDKKKMNEEIMGLYRTYKVNPLGGCLPMIVQIPIFFALYRMLYEAIELRHAPFFGWINDLSAPDRLFNFSFSIPFMQPPYGIPVLTIIMGGTMFLSQKMQPPMGDPAQAKMMMLMPIVFTVIFINFSSGLVLYWLVNNIISIAQQSYVTKKNA